MFFGRNVPEFLQHRDVSEADVSVSFDKAWHQTSAAPVDDFGGMVPGHLIRAAGHSADTVAFHQHFTRERVVARPVKDHNISESCGAHEFLP